MLWRHPALRLLFIALAFGVVGMHTLGHHDEHGGQSSAMAMPVHDAHTSPGDSQTVSMPTGDFDPTQVCLAILSAGALLGLVSTTGRTAARLAARRWGAGLQDAARGIGAPPDVRPFCLFAAEITVLRI